MTHLDRDPHARPGPGMRPVGVGQQRALAGAGIRQAAWSALTAVAMIFVLFVVFYGVNTHREPTTAARSTPPSQVATPVTADQGSLPPAIGTTGQGGRGNDR